MAFPHMGVGGVFKTPAATQSFTHDHASQMAHAALRRLAVAKALSAPKGPPQVPMAGGITPMPGGAAPPPPGGNFKANIAHVAAARGVPVTLNHVHKAIDSLTAKGQFTPFQGNKLKQHNGPLVGQAGQNTMGQITNELLQNPLTRMGA